MNPDIDRECEATIRQLSDSRDTWIEEWTGLKAEVVGLDAENRWLRDTVEQTSASLSECRGTCAELRQRLEECGVA